MVRRKLLDNFIKELRAMTRAVRKKIAQRAGPSSLTMKSSFSMVLIRLEWVPTIG